MIYKVRGVIKEKIYNWNNNKEVVDTIDTPKVYFIEAESFQKATTKAKKALDHVHSISQEKGEFLDL
jgi:hypothetical protein